MLMIEPQELKKYAREIFPNEDYSSLDLFIDNAPKTEVVTTEYAKHVINSILKDIDKVIQTLQTV